ncbi:Ig-like domain-containing protein [Thalassotalea agariperforans]
MINPKLIFSGLMAVVFNATHAADIPPPLSDPENRAGWTINTDVSDEFNGNDFDRNVWWNQGENGQWNGQWKGRAPSQFNPDNVAVRDGYLYMTARWQPDYPFADEYQGGNPTGNLKYGEVAPVTTAALLGKNYFLYGYMEMRSKAAPGPISSSYWTTGNQGETDAFESFGYNPNNKWSAKRFHTSFHDWRVTDGVKSPTYGQRIWDNSHILDFNVAEDFHTYGFEWDKDYVAIYIDGALINCVTRAEMGDAWVATGAQRPWIDMEIFSWEVPASNLSSAQFNGSKGIDFVIDYARVYQRNTPSSGTCLERPNLISNPSFENGMNDWHSSGTGSATNTNSSVHDGDSAASLIGSVTIEQNVTVEPNTTYILSTFANSTGTNQAAGIWRNGLLGVKNYGGSATDVRFFKSSWQEQSLQFTTGSNTTTATVYFTKTQNEAFLIDEMQLYRVGSLLPNKAVSSVNLPETSISLNINDSISLNVEILPLDASDKSVTWVSSNPSIVTVNSEGVITAISAGNAVVTVETSDGLLRDTVDINVNAASSEISVLGISLPSSVVLTVGETRKLDAVILPENASDKAITWSSLNETVATVTNNGTISALAKGTTTISAITTDNNHTATTQLTVNDVNKQEVETSTSSGGGSLSLNLIAVLMVSFITLRKLFKK